MNELKSKVKRCCARLSNSVAVRKKRYLNHDRNFSARSQNIICTRTEEKEGVKW